MKSIKRNYIYSVIYQILIISVPLITAPYLSRVMGANNLGIYSYTNSVAYYFYLFIMLGILNYGNRTIAKIREDKSLLNSTFSELFSMQLLWGSIIILAYLVYLFLLFIMHNEYLIYSCIWSFYILSGVIDISWFFWGIEEFKITLIRNSVIKIVTTIGIFLFVRNKNDITIYIFLISLSSLISQLILWTNLKKYIQIKKNKVSLFKIKKHLKSNLVLFIPVIAVSIYTVMDKLMLGNMCSMNQLGFYDNVQKIMTLPTGLITALGSVMLPRISNLIANGKNKDVFKYIRVSMQFSCIFAFAFVFGLAAIAPTFTIVYFGEGYKECVSMITLFSITIIFISWANVIRTQYLIPKAIDKVYIISTFGGALTNILVNLILIPKYYAKGAIIGTIMAEFIVALIQTYFVRKSLCVGQYIKENIIFLIPGLIMFISVRLLGNILGIGVISLLLQIILGAILYLGISYIILIFSKSLLLDKVKKYNKET